MESSSSPSQNKNEDVISADEVSETVVMHSSLEDDSENISNQDDDDDDDEAPKTEMLRVSSQFYDMMNANGVDIVEDNNNNADDAADEGLIITSPHIVEKRQASSKSIHSRSNNAEEEQQASSKFADVMDDSNAVSVVDISDTSQYTGESSALKGDSQVTASRNAPRSVGAWNVALSQNQMQQQHQQQQPQQQMCDYEDNDDCEIVSSVYIESNELTHATVSSNSFAPSHGQQPTSAVAISNDELMQEIVDQAVVAEVQKEGPSRPNYYTLWLLAAFLLFVAAAILVVVIFQSNDDSSLMEPITILPTASPTISPDTRLARIQQVIQDVFNTTTITTLQDPNAPETKAIEWVATDSAYDIFDQPDRLVQRYVLAMIYFSTNDDADGDNNNWIESFEFVTNDDECNWSGALQCNEDGQVTHIDLMDNGLGGSLPFREISKLKHLESLALGNNKNFLKGEIPTVIGEMTLLTELNLAKSNLGGTIPEALYTLSNLESLLLGENSLSGTISDKIGMLSKLTSLNLELNALSGTIPESLWDLSHMREFLVGEQFAILGGTISTKIGNWTDLTGIEILRNSMTGTLPTELGLLTLLTNFRAGANDFFGTIPTEMANLPVLSQISLSVNGLTGTVPKEFARLKSLRKVYLQNTLLIDDWEWMCDLIEAGEFGPLRPMRADLDEVNCTCCTCCKY